MGKSYEVFEVKRTYNVKEGSLKMRVSKKNLMMNEIKAGMEKKNGNEIYYDYFTTEKKAKAFAKVYEG